MMQEPLFSIITPSFNQGQFIEQTIRSLKRQTCRDFEHIVIDAGSSDGTLDVLRRHEGSYPMHWTSEPDGGMYEAINKGLSRSRGRILAYLNSDDLYFPWTLEVVARQFREQPELDLLYGDVVRLEEASKSFELTFCPPFNLNWAIHIGGLYQPTVFWSRRAYAAHGGFDERLQCVGDYEYWLRIATHSRVKKIDEFLAVDRLQGEAKRYVQSARLQNELTAVRRQYDHHYPSKLRRALYRTYGFAATRYCMARFILQCAFGRARPSAHWPALIGLKDVRLPALHRLLLRFLPLIGESSGRWTVANLPIDTHSGPQSKPSHS